MMDWTDQDWQYVLPPHLRAPLLPCAGPPLTIEVGEETVTVTHADLVRHAGREQVAGVLCLSSVFVSVLIGGGQMPTYSRLYTRQPALLTLWTADALTFTAPKPGRVLLLAASRKRLTSEAGLQ